MNYNNDFFISYSRDISNILILNLLNTFEKFNINVWIDKKYVFSGTLLSETLDLVLDSSRNFLGAIILIDKTYLEKEWCIKELDYFINNNIRKFIFSYKCDLKYIFDKRKDLSKYNIISVEQCITPIMNYDLFITNILSGLLINQSSNKLNYNKLLQLDNILFDLYQDYLNKHKGTILIVSAQGISNWIIYLIYKEMRKKDNIVMPNKEVLLNTEEFPPIIKIIINYIDYFYQHLFLTESLYNIEIANCIKLCVNHLVVWYSTR